MVKRDMIFALLTILIVMFIGITSAVANESGGWIMAICYLLLLRDYFRLGGKP